MAGERGLWPVVGPLAGLIIAAMTVSRATVGLLGMGSAGLLTLSIFRRWTSRKVLILAAGLAVVGLLSPLVLSSFDQRLASVPVQTGKPYDERAAFEESGNYDDLGQSNGSWRQLLCRYGKRGWL